MLSATMSRVLWFAPAVVGAGALILHLRRHRHIHRPRRMKSHPERLPLPLRRGDLGPRTEVTVGRARVVRDARLAAEVQPGAAFPQTRASQFNRRTAFVKLQS